MATYSFMDVTATPPGPTGFMDLGYGAANSKEGISFEYSQPRNNRTVGADGEVMHSLRADKSGSITVRLLYTSPVNAKLKIMFNAQSLSSSAWGNNVLTIMNKGNQDTVVARSVAFQGLPAQTFAEDGQPVLEWVFDCGKIDTLSGTY